MMTNELGFWLLFTEKIERFTELVKRMREAQQAADRAMAESDDYSEALAYVNKAEELEKEVDEWLKKVGI